MEHKNKWWSRMISVHGSEEAVREFMRQSSNKSARNKQGAGGFAKLKADDPAKLRELSVKAAKRRWEK